MEIAGVLASTGLDSLETLHLSKIDVTNEPINIVNNLAKKVTNVLRFQSVTGLCFSMLDNIEAQELYLTDMRIPAQVLQGVNINGKKIYLGVRDDLRKKRVKLGTLTLKVD